MEELKTKVRALAHKLNPEVSIDDSNFKHLPEYCRIEFTADTSLIVALGIKEHYIVSYIHEGTLTSCLTSDLSSDKVVQQLLSPSRNFTDQSPTTSSAKKEGNSSSILFTNSNTNDTNERLRDPNYPPGFEDEHLLRGHPPRGPSLQFNPDADRLPPGGNYPTLGPINPLFGSNSGSGGMFPSTQGSPQGSSNIRYDPTSPFDVGGANGLHNNLGFGGAGGPGGSGFSPF